MRWTCERKVLTARPRWCYRLGMATKHYRNMAVNVSGADLEDLPEIVAALKRATCGDAPEPTDKARLSSAWGIILRLQREKEAIDLEEQRRAEATERRRQALRSGSKKAGHISPAQAWSGSMLAK